MGILTLLGIGFGIGGIVVNSMDAKKQKKENDQKMREEVKAEVRRELAERNNDKN